MRRAIAVYILTNARRTVLYIGVTNDLIRRVHEHREALGPLAFTTLYRVHQLVLFEPFESMVDAIRRERQLKGWRRSRKEALINAANPGWRDLWPELAASG